MYNLERFNMDNKRYGFKQSKTEFEIELCTNDIHVVAKLYTFF